MTSIVDAAPAGRWRRLGAWMALAGAACMPAWAQSPAPHWVATWAAAEQPDFPGPHERYDRRTIRLVVRSTIGGARARVTLSNAHGYRPLAIADARLALLAQGTYTVASSDVALSFEGHRAVLVAPHASVTSDPVDFAVPPLAELALSLHFASPAIASTVHVLTLSTGARSTAAGDVAAEPRWPGAQPLEGWPFLAGIDVEAPPDAFAVVALGDSLVDGDGVTPGTHRRWTELLADRLRRAGGAAARVSVVNEGLIGNRLLRGSPGGEPFGEALGDPAIERLDHDALQRAGVRVLLVRIGVNDLGLPGTVAPATDLPTADELVAGLRGLVARAHERGVRVIGMTLSPFEGATTLRNYFSPAKEVVRQQVNARIRAGGVFDAVVDADALLRDPDHPARLLPRLDHGDHLHPNDAGNAAIADAIPIASLLATDPAP